MISNKNKELLFVLIIPFFRQDFRQELYRVPNINLAHQPFWFNIGEYSTFAYEGFITYFLDFPENNFARENPTSVIASVPNTTVKSS